MKSKKVKKCKSKRVKWSGLLYFCTLVLLYTAPAEGAQPTTGRLVRSDCGAITNPSDYAVDCLQSTTVSGRTAGHTYTWKGTVLGWVDNGSGSGTGTPGGSSGQVQYNSSGAFAGSLGLTFNGTVLTVPGGFVGPLTGAVTGNVTGNASTATALSANPNNCSPGQAPAGITAAGVAEGCFDVATQAELDAHTAGTGSSVHGATSSNSASEIVTRDVSGNFSAGTISAALSGNATTATTAAALTANGTNCAAGQAAAGVDASGNSEGCIVVGSGAGVPVVLDLGNNGSSESGDLAKITTSNDTNSIFTEPNSDELNIDVSKRWPTADVAVLANTATALAANGSNCSAGSFPLGVSAAGAAESCTALPTTITGTANQITASAATGAITLSIPTSPTLPGTTTGTFSGNLSGSVIGNVTGNSTTATALSANGTNCSAGQAAAGVDASGNAEGCSTVLATPGGSDTYVQFNDASTLSGDSGLTYNKNTDVLTAVGGFVGALTGNASTATALASNPTDCLTGEFAIAIAANGNLTCTTPAGGGDVTGPAASVDSEVAIYSSTTGKVLKRATTTGMLKGTAGVLSAGTPGTDYVVPAGNVATATALAANGDNCAAGQAPLGVNASGFAEGCTDYMEEPAASGMVAKTGANTSAGRTIVGTSPITTTTGDGISGNPTIACATCGVTGQPLSQFAATTSAQLAGVISNETGSGSLVFGTAPTLTTPAIADFSSANHTHVGGTTGGKLTASTAMNATGTPSASTFLSGANTWSAPTAAAGGNTTQMQYNNAGGVGGVSGCTSDGTNQTCGTDNFRSTNSRVTTGLRDTNGNPLIAVTPTASAVNGITITNAATTGTPQIAASGSDTNVGLNIAGQGTGTICIGTSCATSATTVGHLEAGDLKLNGTTSGTITIQPQAAAGTYNFNMPITAGTLGQCFVSGGGGSTANTWGTCGGGGGGSASFDAVTSGTNTTAAMVVGAGGSLNYTSTGTINATTVAGATVAPIALAKATNPATTDNTALGYPNGSMWVNTTATPDRVWVKTDEAASVAVWAEQSLTGHVHSAADVTSGSLALARGGTNATSWTASRCVQVNSGGTALESASAACGTGSGGGGVGGNMNVGTANGAPATSMSSAETQIQTVSITPALSTSKILILARVDFKKDAGTTVRIATARIRRGTTNSDPLVSQTSVTRSDNVASVDPMGPAVILAIDTPGTTSATTYRLSGQIDAGNETAERYEITAIELVSGGNVNNTAGALTSNALVLGAGTGETKVAAGLTTDGTSKVTLGVAGASVGSVDFKNATSGTITVSPPTGALGTVTVSLPAATDTLVGKATSDVLTNKTLDAEGTGNVISMPIKRMYWAAGCQNTTASPVWDLPVSTPAVATCITGTNIQKGVLAYADTTGGFSAQISDLLPSDWTTTGGLDAKIIWNTAATSGNVKWYLSTICTDIAATATDDPAFNTANSGTTAAPGTTLRLQTTNITALTTTSCTTATPMILHLKLFRDGNDAADTIAATANVLGVELTFRRAM